MLYGFPALRFILRDFVLYERKVNCACILLSLRTTATWPPYPCVDCFHVQAPGAQQLGSIFFFFSYSNWSTLYSSWLCMHSVVVVPRRWGLYPRTRRRRYCACLRCPRRRGGACLCRRRRRRSYGERLCCIRRLFLPLCRSGPLRRRHPRCLLLHESPAILLLCSFPLAFSSSPHVWIFLCPDFYALVDVVHLLSSGSAGWTEDFSMPLLLDLLPLILP